MAAPAAPVGTRGAQYGGSASAGGGGGGGPSAPPPLTGASVPGRSEHTVALRVMRLLKPELCEPDDTYLEEGDVCYEALRAERDAAAAAAGGFELRLPSSIGQVHDGEAFRICVSLHNVAAAAAAAARQVALTVDLSMASGKKVSLLAGDAKSGSALASFPPRAHKDYILDCPLQEEGAHTLMCNVTYADESVPRTYRKVFKFNVGRTVRIKDVKLWTISDHVMVFVELQNTTPGALRVESHFCPSAAYDLLPVPEEKTEVWQQLMGADEVRRYLFRLVPRPDPHRTAAAAAASDAAKGNSVGRLEIRWTGRMGECGRLESTDIQHRAVEKQQMEVTNMHLPAEVRLHEPFTLTATLVNTHPERTPLSPYITLSADKMYPLSFTGPSQYFIGTIEYGKAVNIQLNLVALTAGVHELGGIEVCDAHTMRPIIPPLTNAYVQAVR